MAPCTAMAFAPFPDLSKLTRTDGHLGHTHICCTCRVQGARNGRPPWRHTAYGQASAVGGREEREAQPAATCASVTAVPFAGGTLGSGLGPEAVRGVMYTLSAWPAPPSASAVPGPTQLLARWRSISLSVRW
jgi:hypothetical protein